MIVKLNDKNYIRKKMDDTIDEADGLAELICEGGAEGEYTQKELLTMQNKADTLYSLYNALEMRLKKLNNQLS